MADRNATRHNARTTALPRSRWFESCVSSDSQHDQRDCRRRNRSDRGATPSLVRLPEQGQHSDRIDDDQEGYETVAPNSSIADSPGGRNRGDTKSGGHGSRPLIGDPKALGLTLAEGIEIVSANVVYLATIWVIPVIIAITFHEAAHGFVAHLLGERSI